MKLVRPDVFHPRIVLAGCPQLIGGDADDAGLVGALRKRGLHARWLSWDDPETLRAHLVIVRATRDHAERLDEFLAWTTTVPNLLNAPEVIAWNVGKRYLLDLARRGVPVVPTDEHVAPAEETALVFLAGKASHAFTQSGPAEPDFEIWDLGFAALDAAAAQLNLTARDFLYARADVVSRSDDPRLLQLELVEPSLGWMRLDQRTRELQQREFARSVASALDRRGLGPLSHRRP